MQAENEKPENCPVCGKWYHGRQRIKSKKGTYWSYGHPDSTYCKDKNNMVVSCPPVQKVLSVEEIENIIKDSYGECRDLECNVCLTCAKVTAQAIHQALTGEGQ